MLPDPGGFQVLPPGGIIAAVSGCISLERGLPLRRLHGGRKDPAMGREPQEKGSGCLLAILYVFAAGFGAGAVLLAWQSVPRYVAGNVQDGGMFGIPAVFLAGPIE